MTPSRSRSLVVPLLVTALAASLVSLAALIARPESTGTLRTVLNVVAVLCVLVAVTTSIRAATR